MTAPRIIDRYALFDEIAAGGMGVVHVGRLAGSQGFARIVAIKRLHPNLAKDPEFVEMFVDEARLAARIRHPNVVITLDVVSESSGEVLVVMDYVHGATISKVLSSRSGTCIDFPYTSELEKMTRRGRAVCRWRAAKSDCTPSTLFCMLSSGCAVTVPTPTEAARWKTREHLSMSALS